MAYPLHSVYNCPEEVIIAGAVIAGIIQNILKQYLILAGII